MSFWKIIGGEDDGDEKKKRAAEANTVPSTPDVIKPQPAEPAHSAAVEPVQVVSSGQDPEKYGKVRSALGPGTVIQGKLSFDTTVSIDGKLSGEVVSSKAIIVGAGGDVDAVMNVASLVVRGRVKGKIVATETVELLSGAQLEGEVQTPSLMVEEGAILRATCSMSNSKVKAIR
jgi:cytoskeletal protein CcmA (bactofilin family)